VLIDVTAVGFFLLLYFNLLNYKGL